MMEWFNSLLAFVTNLVAQNSFGALLALSLVAALTEIGVPFPFIIDGALFITSYNSGLFSLQVLFVISALVLGRVVGATTIFWLSRFVGDAFINWLSKRFPKLKLKERMVSLSAMFNRRAAVAVAIARLTPGLLTPSSVAAGYSRMRYHRFVLGIVLASIVADGALVIVGVAAKYGLSILGFTPSTWEVVLAIPVIILLVWFVRWRWARRRAHRSSIG